MNYAAYLITLCMPLSTHASLFEQRIEQLRREKPHLFTPHSPAKKQPINTPELIDTAHQLTNGGAMAYALAGTLSAYRAIYTNSASDLNTQNRITTYLQRALRMIVPSKAQTLQSHTLFAYAIAKIALKTIFYKTIINVILFCGQSDLFDLIT